MNKKSFKIITAVALAAAFLMATGSVFASTKNVPDEKQNNGCKMERHVGLVYDVLKNDLGFKDEEIKSAKKSGKTAFDLAKQKGITSDKLKEMIIEKQSKEIDKEVDGGKIPKEKAAEVKEHFKEKMSKWDGKLKMGRCKGGMHNPVYGILEKDLGYTKEQIKSAADSGKTAFDLAKQKGITQDKFRTMIIDKNSQNIDKAIADGKIPKEKADEMKSSFKTKIQSWDGSLKHKK